MKLLEFPHSHYCEKARWALDFKGLEFEAVPILPMFHLITIKKFAPNTTVPVLLNAEDAKQGSSEIITYLDDKYPTDLLTPSKEKERKKCLEIEQQMDECLGENLRRIYYSKLLAYPELIGHCFTHPMPKIKQIIFKLIYPFCRYKIYQHFVISEQRVDQSIKDFAKSMDELAVILEGKEYLIDDRFSRADLSIASMLSLMIMPKEHPFPWQEMPDPYIKSFQESYHDHPVSTWVRMIYSRHR